jgi:uncharacterized membrane protein HdeD (DUF308 family)
MITDDIVSAYNRGKWALIIRGVLGIALGVVIFTRPLASVAAFALVVAIWALSDGIVSIVHAFELRPVLTHWWALLLSGLVSVAFGVAALYFYPVLSLTFAVVWTAWWLISAGVLAIYASVQERKIDVPWGWTLTFGIIALAAGVLAIMYPGITLATLMGTMGTFGIVGGIAMLVGAGKLQSFQHDVKRAIRTPSHA